MTSKLVTRQSFWSATKKSNDGIHNSFFHLLTTQNNDIRKGTGDFRVIYGHLFYII